MRFVGFALVLKWCPDEKMYDLLPLLGFEVVPRCEDVRFVAVALVLNWCPNARSGAPMRGYTICCLCSGLEVVPPNAKMYDLRPLLRSPRCPNAEMCDLLPLIWFRSVAVA